METRCDTVSGELHATFMDNSPSGSHALPLIAPPVAQPLAQPVAQPEACQRHGTADTADAGELLPEPVCPCQATRSPAGSPTHWACMGAHAPTMKQPAPTPIVPHQHTEKSPQNQHALPLNPRKAAPRGGLPRVTARRSAHDPDMGRHLAGCSIGSVDFRTRWTSSALIVSS